ncbi:cyclase family protein [Acidaminobacter hydrogenoformans]|uniref:Kynurenine formamidase n=1 Tax=Acidaminobacter hydrogenoformans DSM 2784 TaxID=1120920 RepID=A0A1G5RTV7_9FIRM|nr:cyclase family protein [Acidaminobacter hydrogenoformans]SCZ77288.1 Kynurenine formamidase [Acidaminobacter hydrogenoformans DSM 2784]
MKIIDLTHLIKENMPVFPGTEPPVLEAANTLERDGFREKKLHMYSHTGTHMDAPAHMINKGWTLDQVGIEAFFGPAVKIDARGLKRIEKIHLEPLTDSGAEFLVLWTGWDQYWGTEKYFGAFPALSLEAAAWLTGLSLKGIGVDAISIDPMDSEDFAVHLELLSNDMVLIENLRGLEQLPEQFIFSAMPLKLEDADGSPVRAYALLEADKL